MKRTLNGFTACSAVLAATSFAVRQGKNRFAI
jgi:hypothetical protein